MWPLKGTEVLNDHVNPGDEIIGLAHLSIKWTEIRLLTVTSSRTSRGRRWTYQRQVTIHFLKLSPTEAMYSQVHVDLLRRRFKRGLHQGRHRLS